MGFVFKKVLWVVYIIVITVLVGWFLISYIDVLAHNLQEGYEYPAWNFFYCFFSK